jgi:hypothetical protein
MTSATILAQIRFLTNQNATTLGDTDCVRLMNIYFNRLVQSIVDVNEDFFADYSTFDLVNAQREYTLPTDCLKIKRLEISYDATNWDKATPITEHEIGIPLDDSNATEVDTNFSSNNPAYHIFNGSLFLYPKPSAASEEGGKLWYIKRQTALAADTTEANITIPIEFHYLIAEGASADVFRRLGKEDRAQVADSNFARGEAQMKAKVSGRNLDDSMRLSAEIQSYR